jgi:uncharacterized MAPEG superfamily protein
MSIIIEALKCVGFLFLAAIVIAMVLIFVFKGRAKKEYFGRGNKNRSPRKLTKIIKRGG